MNDTTDMTVDQFEHACTRAGLKWWPEYRGGHEHPRVRVRGKTYGCCIDATTERVMRRETLEMWLQIRDRLTAKVAA